MDESIRKPMLTPLGEALQAAWQTRGEQRPPKPLVGGSIPSGPARFFKEFHVPLPSAIA